MTGRDYASVVLDGSRPAREEWCRNLARALPGCRAPAGALFELSSERSGVTVTVRPRDLLAVLETFAGAEPVGLRPTGAFEPARARRPRPERYAAFVPRPVDRGARRLDPEPRPRRPSLVPWHDRGARFDLQSFWVRRTDGPLDVAVWLRVSADHDSTLAGAAGAANARLLTDLRGATGLAADTRWLSRRSRRPWERGDLRAIPPEAWRPWVDGDSRVGELGLSEFQPDPEPGGAHTVVFGASGTGKTTFLAGRATEAIGRGEGVLLLDLQGDLAPQVVARLPPALRPRVVAVDAGARPVPGIAGLVAAGPASVDRAAAHFVAAIKRLTPDGAELAWGFRLERIFDTFARLVLDRGGSLLDLYALLTDPDRREAARLETRRPSVARFLDELGPIVRRDPEFLWSAATRLSKVALVPALMELLSPREGGLDAESLVEGGRALLVRLPVGTLGPEGAGFAGTLLLGRLTLGLAARASPPGDRRPVVVLLDEVQGLSPRMVAELLAEGRKFGLEVTIATQYPDRLTPEVRSAAAGAVGGFVAFRVPPASAAKVGEWVGLDAETSTRLLPGLPVGAGVAREAAQDDLRDVRSAPVPSDGGVAWQAALATTRQEFGVVVEPEEPVDEERFGERVLLAVLAAEESGAPLRPSKVIPSAVALPGPLYPADRLELAWTRLLRGRALLIDDAGSVRLTGAGERRLGLGRTTGASRETAEHRALLLRAFRLFARRGYLLEVLRQGRFDTTLPDAILHQLDRAPSVESPGELAARLDRVRTGWAWRFFSGRDVHVEAEVSGALRPERVRHGVAKARAHDAFALFLVGDARRARRVRQTLRSMGLGPDRAQVWTLRPPADAPNL